MAITKLDSSKDYFRIWFLWKRQAIILFWLIVILVVAYAYTAKSVYESNAELLVMPKTWEGEVITSGSDTQEEKIQPVTPTDIYTEIELLTSHSVLVETVRSLGAEQSKLSDEKKSILSVLFSPVKSTISAILEGVNLQSDLRLEEEKQVAELKDSLIINPVIDSNVISIAVHGDIAQNTFKVLKNLLDNYFTHRSRVLSQQEGQKFFNDQAVDFKASLNQAETKLKAFELSQNIVSFNEQITTQIGLISKLTAELNLLEIDYVENCAKIGMLKHRMDVDQEGVYLTKNMRNIPAVLELEKGLVPVLIDRSKLSGGYTKSSREYQIIDQQIDMLRNEIRFEIKKAIRTDELELQSKRIKILSLIEKIDQLKSTIRDLNQKGHIHQDLIRKAALYKRNVALYENKAEESSVFNEKSERRLANVNVSSEPALLQIPIAPKRGTLVLIALVGGFIAALVFPFLFELMDNKLKSADDVEVLVKLPVICSFNEIK